MIIIKYVKGNANDFVKQRIYYLLQISKFKMDICNTVMECNRKAVSYYTECHHWMAAKE